MSLKDLPAWLEYILTLSSKQINLGLDRVRIVAQRLDLLSIDAVVITIGGTNGKGSTVAGLEAIYLAEGYKVGAFTSPYLIRLNEEFRLNGKEVSDEMICEAFEIIEAAREGENLTPFEFNTLAAIALFKNAKVDCMLLEVGLGGRLDAVNVLNCDLAVITSIGIDHVEYLGSSRELIAKEKAGILRAHKPTVCGDINPPSVLMQHALDLESPLYYRGRDFSFTEQNNDWTWQCKTLQIENLPFPKLALENMSSVLQVIELLQIRLPVSKNAIIEGIRKATLPGRIQFFPGKVTRIFDVSHNPAAAEFLKNKLSSHACNGKTAAVFSMLADKDIVGTINEIKDIVDVWYIAELDAQRAASLSILQEALQASGISQIKIFPIIVEAYQAAIDESEEGDRVLTFGSFHTVAEVTTQLLSTC